MVVGQGIRGAWEGDGVVEREPAGEPTMASLKLTKEPPRVRNGDQVQLLVGNCTSTCCANSDGDRGDRGDCDISVKTAVFMESGSVVDRCYL